MKKKGNEKGKVKKDNGKLQNPFKRVLNKFGGIQTVYQGQRVCPGELVTK